jgi:hypothetical protein
MKCEVKGNEMVITVDLTQTPRQSKSAVEKAVKKGLKPEQVPATLVDTTGGFIQVGKFKFSGNVTIG